MLPDVSNTLFLKPTSHLGSGFWSSEEASWLGKVPLPASLEVFQQRDPLMVEEVVVGEQRLILTEEAGVEVAVVVAGVETKTREVVVEEMECLLWLAVDSENLLLVEVETLREEDSEAMLKPKKRTKHLLSDQTG